jgi:glycosyltransferase involved in cell wall biosynthesis
MHYYGFRGDNKRLILVEPDMGYGQREETLSFIYSSFDVQVSTTQGEGWGLTTMEGMACGVPQIVPEWSALGEWTRGVAIQVPCSTYAVTSNNRVNVIGGVPDRDAFVDALHSVWALQWRRDAMSANGLSLVAENQYRWPIIGNAFLTALNEVPLKKAE